MPAYTHPSHTHRHTHTVMKEQYVILCFSFITEHLTFQGDSWLELPVATGSASSGTDSGVQPPFTQSTLPAANKRQ